MGGERGAVVMAGPRDKGKSKASLTGDAPVQPKRRRGGAAAAAPPQGLEVAPRSGGSVHTKETTAFDVAHRLRSGRTVLVPQTNKPGPLHTGKRKKLAYDIPSEIRACVKFALEHYNRLNEDVHELVKAVDGYIILFKGQWVHVNFVAKSKQGTLKAFFAELKIEGMEEMSCTMCTVMNPEDPKTAPIRGACGGCPSRIYHPAAGGHIADKPVGPVRAEHRGAAPASDCGEFDWLFNGDAMASA